MTSRALDDDNLLKAGKKPTRTQGPTADPSDQLSRLTDANIVQPSPRCTHQLSQGGNGNDLDQGGNGNNLLQGGNRNNPESPLPPMDNPEPRIHSFTKVQEEAIEREFCSTLLQYVLSCWCSPCMNAKELTQSRTNSQNHLSFAGTCSQNTESIQYKAQGLEMRMMVTYTEHSMPCLHRLDLAREQVSTK